MTQETAHLQVLSIGRASHRGLVLVSIVGNRLRASIGVADARAVLDAAAGESAESLGARARRELTVLTAIDETLRESWPRLDHETPDQAQHWLAAGFSDPEVVAWLEVGVPWSTSAQQLRDAGVAPREVGGEYELDVTLGLAFARGEVSLGRVLELRRAAREVTC